MPVVETVPRRPWCGLCLDLSHEGKVFLKSGKQGALSQVVTATHTPKNLAQDPSPFLFADMPESAPLSERAKLESESKLFTEAVASNGPLLLPSMAARVVGVSQQRVSALVDEGKLAALNFFGHRWVYLHELQSRQAAPKNRGGRPRVRNTTAA